MSHPEKTPGTGTMRTRISRPRRAMYVRLCSVTRLHAKGSDRQTTCKTPDAVVRLPHAEHRRCIINILPSMVSTTGKLKSQPPDTRWTGDLPMAIVQQAHRMQVGAAVGAACDAAAGVINWPGDHGSTELQQLAPVPPLACHRQADTQAQHGTSQSDREDVTGRM